MIKKIIALSALLVGAYVFATAPRKVTINTGASYSSNSSFPGITLFNGSSSTVNYKISCYDKNGSSTFSKVGLSLNPKSGKTHAAAVCGDGIWLNKVINGGILLCGNNTTLTPSYCPTNYQVCTYNQVKAIPFDNLDPSTEVSGWATGFSFTVSGYWSFGYTSNSTTSWTGANYSTGDYPVATNNSNAKCNDGSSGFGPNTIDFCTKKEWSAPTLCCPTANTELPSYSCDVEIDSTTPSNGFLQSPQFKANAPF